MDWLGIACFIEGDIYWQAPMEFIEDEQKVIRRYLLGDLDEDQRERLDDLLFTSTAFDAHLHIVEDELAEDYLAGRLSAPDREAFQRRLLVTDEQKRRVEMISALMALAADRRRSSTAAAAKKNRPFSFGDGWRFRMILAAATVVVIIAATAFWLLRYSSKNSPDPAELARRHEIEREVVRLNPPGGRPLPAELIEPAAHIASANLNPNDLDRSGGKLAKVEIPDGVTIVRLRLKLPIESYDSYRITLYTSEGIELLRHDPLAPAITDGVKDKDLVFNLPSSALPTGDYRLKLSGRRGGDQFEEAADYNLRVIQRKFLPPSNQ